MRAGLVAVALSLGVLLAGCGGGGGPQALVDPPSELPVQEAECSDANQRASLRSYMDDQYFWPAQAGDALAVGQDAHFHSMLYKPDDRYSHSELTAARNMLRILGKRVGYGYTVVWGDAAQTVLKLRSVEPASPIGLAGLKRGDTVLSIDGYTPAQVLAGSPGPVTVKGVPREFRVKGSTGEDRVITVRSDEFALSAVPATTTFDISRPIAEGSETVKVGYLAYQQFATYGFLELGSAIRSMSAAGVRELVLDLRYNSGGSVNIARDLGSMVGGSRTNGQLFTSLRFNSRHPESNRSINFATRAAALPAPPIEGLSRVLVIVSPSTASASEVMINGLRPYMQVVLIGGTTYGKPFGFVPRESCGRTYNAVNFETFNAQGEGRFTTGFVPDCTVADDLDRQLGDPQEGRTRAALDYVATGHCPTQQPMSATLGKPQQAPLIGEASPPQMFLD